MRVFLDASSWLMYSWMSSVEMSLVKVDRSLWVRDVIPFLNRLFDGKHFLEVITHHDSNIYNKYYKYNQLNFISWSYRPSSDLFLYRFKFIFDCIYFIYLRMKSTTVGK